MSSLTPGVSLIFLNILSRTSTSRPFNNLTLFLRAVSKSSSPSIASLVSSPTSFSTPASFASSFIISFSTIVESISKTINRFFFLYIHSGWITASSPDFSILSLSSFLTFSGSSPLISRKNSIEIRSPLAFRLIFSMFMPSSYSMLDMSCTIPTLSRPITVITCILLALSLECLKGTTLTSSLSFPAFFWRRLFNLEMEMDD